MFGAGASPAGQHTAPGRSHTSQCKLPSHQWGMRAAPQGSTQLLVADTLRNVNYPVISGECVHVHVHVHVEFAQSVLCTVQSVPVCITQSFVASLGLMPPTATSDSTCQI